MRVLFLGDVVGRSGRESLKSNLLLLKKEMKIDFCIVNAENATSGVGLSVNHANDLFEAGADCITLGDHAFDQKEMIGFIEKEKRIIRPLNFANSAPGRGMGVFTTYKGEKILVLQVLGTVFMKKNFSDPFLILEKIFKKYILGVGVDTIFLDIHAEATSEKMALGLWCDGKVSMSIGTHTHVPTSDLKILPLGSGYQSDAGMCGDYNSVIGMEKEEPISRFVTGMNRNRFQPAKGIASICGVFFETNSNGLVKETFPIIEGGAIGKKKFID